MTTDKSKKDEAQEAAKPEAGEKQPKASKRAPKSKTQAQPGQSVRAKKDPLDIGIDVKAPSKTCADKFCPFHGTLPVRGQILEGEVVSDKMQMTAVVKREFMRKNRKYERLEKRSSKYLVHSPPCLETRPGDHVRIMECRPLSKQVSFVIVEKMDRV
jgi:small subunit ribosomal protein S17